MLKKETVEAMFAVAKATNADKPRNGYRPRKKKETPGE